MAYYEALEAQLKYIPGGCSWLQAHRRSLEVPKNLVAQNLLPHEYDRLSVAYGLSLLEVGSIVKSLPMPKLMESPIKNWRDNYTDKDQC